MAKRKEPRTITNAQGTTFTRDYIVGSDKDENSGARSAEGKAVAGINADMSDVLAADGTVEAAPYERDASPEALAEVWRLLTRRSARWQPVTRPRPTKSWNKRWPTLTLMCGRRQLRIATPRTPSSLKAKATLTRWWPQRQNGTRPGTATTAQKA